MDDRAVQAMKEKKYNLAIDLYTRVINENPREMEALEGISRAFHHTNRLDEARQYAEKALEINPNRPTPYVTLASVRYQQGSDPNTAYSLAETAYRLAPNSVDSLVILGWASLLVKKYAQGVHLLEKAALLEPNGIDVHENLLFGYVQLHNPEQSYREARLLLKLNPSFNSFYWLMASFLNRKGVKVFSMVVLYGGIIGAILLHSPALLLIPAVFVCFALLGSAYLFYRRRIRPAVSSILLDFLIIAVIYFLYRKLS